MPRRQQRLRAGRRGAVNSSRQRTVRGMTIPSLGSGPACREEQVLAAGLEDELQAVVAVAIGGVGAGACGLEYTGRRDPEVLLAEHHRVRRCRQALGDLTTAGLPDPMAYSADGPEQADGDHEEHRAPLDDEGVRRTSGHGAGPDGHGGHHQHPTARQSPGISGRDANNRDPVTSATATTISARPASAKIGDSRRVTARRRALGTSWMTNAATQTITRITPAARVNGRRGRRTPDEVVLERELEHRARHAEMTEQAVAWSGRSRTAERSRGSSAR